MNLERIYLALPPFLQNTLCTVQGARIQRKRYGAGFGERLADAETRTFWSAEQASDFRDHRLRNFVAHCAANVPFYRKRFAALGIDPRDISGMSDLHRLPIVTKDEVQANLSEFRADNIDPRSCTSVHTSGTTGGGLIFNATHSAVEEQWATWWRYRRWHGIALDTWCAYFGGRSLVPVAQTRPPYWRTNRAGHQLFFSAYHINADTLRAYATKVRESQLPWLHGYPSILALIAGWIIDNNFDIGYRPQWITIGAENLLPLQSELIARAFGVSPIQHYGMAEGVANISQCSLGRLHVDEDFAAVEFVPSGADTYTVVGTNFSNYATPLLRYDVQDQVTLGNESCDCGRPGRVVRAIDGRREDYVVLKNGSRLGRLDHIFKDMVRIREAQIVQRERGRFIVSVVRAEGFTDSDEQILRREFRQRVGADTEFCIEYVSALQRSRTGKLRFVISELKDAQLDRRAASNTLD